MTSRTGDRPEEGGFALALVVLLLFAIGVAAATGYQVVSTEARLALQTHEGVQALAIARAGLELFVAEELGEPPDTVVYPLSGGEAVVSSRKVYDLTVPDELYVLTSTGTYADPRGQTAPATRTVRQYVVRRASPMNRLGGLVALSGNVRIDDGATVDGRDNSQNNDCDDARESPGDITGIVAVDGINIQTSNDVTGNPQSFQYADSASLANALDLPWELLKDPTFPMGEYDDVWPTSFPADSFYAVRVNGDLSATAQQSGQGVLIVTGTFSPSDAFNWDGIVLAGELDPPTGNTNRPWGLAENTFTINGILVAGLNGDTRGQVRIREPAVIRYHFCEALEAGRALAHLEPLDGTWTEGM